MKHAVLILFASGVMLSAAGDGLRPRGDASDYPAHASSADLTIGAAVIPEDQVRKLFAIDLNRAGYVVIEVAVYPQGDKAIDVAAQDFMMRAGSNGNAVRAATPDAIAAMMEDRKTGPAQARGGRDITLYPTANIGYESGIDPATGRRVNGVYHGEGVGVGIGSAGGPPPPPPAVSERDRATMEQELTDKAIPEGKTTRAVAGYLYFPRPAKTQKNAPVDLTWYAAGGTVRLSIPQQHK